MDVMREPHFSAPPPILPFRYDIPPNILVKGIPQPAVTVFRGPYYVNPRGAEYPVILRSAFGALPPPLPVPLALPAGAKISDLPPQSALSAVQLRTWIQSVNLTLLTLAPALRPVGRTALDLPVQPALHTVRTFIGAIKVPPVVTIYMPVTVTEWPVPFETPRQIALRWVSQVNLSLLTIPPPVADVRTLRVKHFSNPRVPDPLVPGTTLNLIPLLTFVPGVIPPEPEPPPPQQIDVAARALKQYAGTVALHAFGGEVDIEDYSGDSAPDAAN